MARRFILFPIALAVLATSSIAGTQSDEWRRNVTNLVVATSSVEMLTLRLNQAERACSNHSESLHATLVNIRDQLKTVEFRFSKLQSYVRSQAKIHLSAQSESEHYQAVSATNIELVKQVQNATASTPQVTFERCKAAIASYQEQALELEQLAQSLESQPNLRRK